MNTWPPNEFPRAEGATRHPGPAGRAMPGIVCHAPSARRARFRSVLLGRCPRLSCSSPLGSHVARLALLGPERLVSHGQGKHGGGATGHHLRNLGRSQSIGDPRGQYLRAGRLVRLVVKHSMPRTQRLDQQAALAKKIAFFLIKEPVRLRHVHQLKRQVDVRV